MKKREKIEGTFEIVHKGLFGRIAVIGGEGIDGKILDDTCYRKDVEANGRYGHGKITVTHEMTPLEIVVDQMGTVPPPSKKQQPYPYPTNENFMKIGNRIHDFDCFGTLAFFIVVIVAPFACAIWFVIRLIG